MAIFNLGELFCGPGGGALGAIRSSFIQNGEEWGFEHTWASDIDSDTCETFRRNIVSANPDSVICEDVRSLNIPDLAPIDAFAFGFPCNDFSIVGETNGLDGNFGPLYAYGVEVINHFQPSFFLAENVGGIRGANAGQAFIQILNELQKAGDNGYSLYPHLYCLSDYGVPQKRKRVVIVGINNDEVQNNNINFQVPAPITANNPITAGEALNGLNRTNLDQRIVDSISNDLIAPNAANHNFTAHPNHVVERLQNIPPGHNAWNSNLPPHLALNVPNVQLSHIYRRLEENEPSYTVTGNGGGGTHMYHWLENRALTNRERARLQTFPDDFDFFGNNGSIRSQIGMAIPPLGAQIIFDSILKSFAHIEYDSIEPNLLDWTNNLNPIDA